jgi:NTP pyrophosphatase (non-canonical NTP hydrolase)
MNKHQQLESYKNILREAIQTDGLDFCISCLVEECAELIVAVSHYRRNRVSITEVIEEIADVVLMADTVRVGLDNEVGFADFIKAKSERMGNRISFKKGNVKNEVL